MADMLQRFNALIAQSTLLTEMVGNVREGDEPSIILYTYDAKVECGVFYFDELRLYYDVQEIWPNHDIDFSKYNKFKSLEDLVFQMEMEAIEND